MITKNHGQGIYIQGGDATPVYPYNHVEHCRRINGGMTIVCGQSPTPPCDVIYATDTTDTISVPPPPAPTFVQRFQDPDNTFLIVSIAVIVFWSLFCLWLRTTGDDDAYTLEERTTCEFSNLYDVNEDR